MILAVHQPQYLPWSGSFDKMDQADLFVLLDTVQFEKNGWQNRNKIKTAQGYVKYEGKWYDSEYVENYKAWKENYTRVKELQRKLNAASAAMRSTKADVRAKARGAFIALASEANLANPEKVADQITDHYA